MRPQTARAALALREHRHGGVVDADALGRVHAGTNRVAQRHQGGGAGPDPVGQGRHVELDALAGVDLALPVERQVRAVFAEQHVGEQLRAGASARDRMRRGRRLRDARALPARPLLAHGLDHLPLRRHALRRLGDVLAELPEPTAAARARRGRRLDAALARQRLRQRPACRLASRRRGSRGRQHAARLARLQGRDLGGRLGLGRVLHELAELQLQLIEQAGARTMARTARAAAWRW
jgi:hypothetical protein